MRLAALRQTIGLALGLAASAGRLEAQGVAPQSDSAPHTSASLRRGRSATQAVAAGRVVLPRAADTVPVPGVRVVLHRVGRAVQGPVDSLAADAAGRFRFRFRADSAEIYLLSARYGDIEYFSPPVRTGAATPDTAIRLIVYDTSSTAAIGVAARHIVVPRAGSDGTRSVLDLVVLENTGRLARVAPNASRPSWRVVLPAGAGELQVGEGDVSPDAILRSGDTVNVLAPLAPGQKQISLEYGVTPSRGAIDFAAGPGGGPLNLLVEERDARVSGDGLALADSQVIEGRTFRRFTGVVPPGGIVRLTLGGLAGSTAVRWGLPGLVAVVALVLAAAAWRLLRRPSPAPTPTAERLLDAIAALDARYAGREGETAADEWQEYASERARLKAELEHGLAASGRSPYS